MQDTANRCNKLTTCKDSTKHAFKTCRSLQKAPIKTCETRTYTHTHADVPQRLPRFNCRYITSETPNTMAMAPIHFIQQYRYDNVRSYHPTVHFFI